MPIVSPVPPLAFPVPLASVMLGGPGRVRAAGSATRPADLPDFSIHPADEPASYVTIVRSGRARRVRLPLATTGCRWRRVAAAGRSWCHVLRESMDHNGLAFRTDRIGQSKQSTRDQGHQVISTALEDRSVHLQRIRPVQRGRRVDALSAVLGQRLRLPETVHGTRIRALAHQHARGR